MKLILHSITVVKGNKVEYNYSYDKELQKYFSKEVFYVEYSVDVSKVPQSILVIPFLANVLPVSWFAGFDVEVPEVDKIYFESVEKIKKTFHHFYPQIKDVFANFIPLKLIQNNRGTNKAKNAMLFSGGVDAYTTFLRHYSEVPDLITIKGADIDIEDTEQWDAVLNYNLTTVAISQNKKFYIESNLRRFLTFEVDKLLPGLGWWGKVQHGLALTSLTAPLAFVNNYKTIYIGSTRSNKMPFSPWGSMPEIDDLVKFGDSAINHDGYELTRLDKIKTVIELSTDYKIQPLLRVCYHDAKEQLNCNICEKCCRTIFAIMLFKRNPEQFGLHADENIYRYVRNHLENGFSSAGTKFYWAEILQSYDKDNFYFIKNEKIEDAKIREIIDVNKRAQELIVNQKSYTAKYLFKQKIIHKYPRLFKLYLQLRRKL